MTADGDHDPAEPAADADLAAEASAADDAGAQAEAPPKPDPNAPGIRVDKWLWYTRFFKSRTLAAKAVQGGLRISGDKTDKPNRLVRVGDVLTFQQGKTIRVIRVEALGSRRGPASEARQLFTDLSPPQPKTKADPAPPPGADRAKGAGRPTKRERRQLDKLHGTDDVI
jgi:ribosome-associated heat shock protein Hsp15